VHTALEAAGGWCSSDELARRGSPGGLGTDGVQVLETPEPAPLVAFGVQKSRDGSTLGGEFEDHELWQDAPVYGAS